MINLEELLKMWEEDCKIDKTFLDESSIKFARVHSKYLTLLSESRLTRRLQTAQLDNLRKEKGLYYSGKMSKQEMDTRQWAYDPFNGASKPLRSEMEPWIETDPEVSVKIDKLEYTKTIIQALEEIMSTLQWRHNVVRNILEFQKWSSGA